MKILKTPENVAKAKRMFADGHTLDQIKDHFGVKSKSTIGYWVNEESFERHKEWRKSYKRTTSPTSKRRHRDYQRTRYQTDIEFKLAKNLRSRVRSAIQNQQKAGSAVSDLGCTVAELKSHLELRFVDGMSWDNYGEWHIDHIEPLSKFDLTDRKQFLSACHYTNLQPLWAQDNWKKSNLRL